MKNKKWLANISKAPVNPLYRIRQLQFISYLAFLTIGALLATLIIVLIVR